MQGVGESLLVLVHLALVVVVCQLAPPPFVGRYVVGTVSERLYARLADRWPVVLGAEAALEVERVLAPAGEPVAEPGERAPGETEPPPAEPTNVVR